MNKISPRTWTFVFAVIALLSLVLLAASLNTLQFDPGHPVSFEQLAPDVVDNQVSDGWMRSLLAVFRVVLIISWVLIPAYIILLIVSKEARKRFLRDMAMLLPILLLLYFLSSSRMAENVADDLNLKMSESPLTELESTPAPPPPEFVPPPQWVTTITIVAIALVVTLILVAIIYILWKRSRSRDYEPLRRVEKEAKAAISAIEAGGDLREVILRCYVQMIDALKEYRGIYRDRDMTPHEFELFLQDRGLPREPIHQLTQLFEQVRYGAIRPGRQDEYTAIASLSAIVSACQKTRIA